MSAKLATRKKIIDAGLAVLVDSGHAAFTQQQVAERAGISLGNLTYHFATKTHLLDAMIDDWLQEWEAGFSIALHIKMENNSEIEGLIDWVMDGALMNQNLRLYRELWAMSNHDAKLEAMLHTLYDKAVDFFLNEFDCPDTCRNDENLRNLIYVLACVSEGAAAVWISSPSSKANPDIIKHHVRRFLAPALKQAISGATQKNIPAAIS